MDLHAGVASKNDLEYLQTQMKNVYATQAEHADRLMRLEQRQDGDSRLKSVWGNQSPFPGLLNGTSQQDPSYNPAAEAFKNFDQDQSSNMLGSLHLYTDDEPRRGAASRANSVRFDESAIHGHFGQGSRSSTADFFPMRTGSAFGSHPMTERSSSHKSDGRQSSAHSARASSIGLESRPLSATVPSFVPSGLSIGPPPGLFILGPVPSIIRCWLDTNFSNESLLYAAVCTGSYKSAIDVNLLARLGYLDQVTTNLDGQRVIRLPVYLPEATIQQSSSRSSSPAPQLPTITTDFVVEEVDCQTDTIQVFLGCDVLRLRNADIHFSLDRLTLFDDERNKLSIPLVRPENAALFQNLQTTITNGTFVRPSDPPQVSGNLNPEDGDEKATERNPKPSVIKEQDRSAEGKTQSSVNTAPTPTASPSVIGEGRKALPNQSNAPNPPSDSKLPNDLKGSESLMNGTTHDTPTKPETSNIWGSWRRDSTQGNQSNSSTATNSTSGYQRAGRGGNRGMKVLKPARLNTTRSSSTQQPPAGSDAASSRFGDTTTTTNTTQSSGQSDRDENASPLVERKLSSASGDAKSASGSAKPRSANPTGGIAFHWLNSGGSRQKSSGE